MTFFEIIVTIDCKKNWGILEFIEKIMKSCSNCVFKEDVIFENGLNKNTHFFPKCQNCVHVICKKISYLLNLYKL